MLKYRVSDDDIDKIESIGALTVKERILQTSSMCNSRKYKNTSYSRIRLI